MAGLRQGVLPKLLGYRLRLAQQAVFDDFAASVEAISPGRLGVLVLIDSNPGLSQSRLAEAVHRDRSTMVGVLNELEKLGLVQRLPGKDRRTNSLLLTRSGKAFLERALRQIEAHEARIASRLTGAERAKLLALLAKIGA
jgi:DNA-binding MarR family transcriptional regulator